MVNAKLKMHKYLKMILSYFVSFLKMVMILTFKRKEKELKNLIELVL